MQLAFRERMLYLFSTAEFAGSWTLAAHNPFFNNEPHEKARKFL
jgi:hypothetical protein